MGFQPASTYAMRSREQALARTRLASQFAVMALLGLAICAFCFYLALRHQEEWLILRLIEQRAANLRQAHATLPFSSSLGYVVRHDLESAGLPDHLRSLEPGYHVLSAPDGLEHVIVAVTEGARLYAVYSDGLHRERVARLGRILLVIVVGAGAVLVVLSSWWAGRLVVQRPRLRLRLGRPRAPVSRTLARREIQPMPLPEVPYTTREFIANVGHELRTPITLVLTGCELLLETTSLSERDREQLRRIMGAAEHMSETVRSFMILARDGDFGATETVDLRGVMIDALGPHREEIRRRGLNLSIDISIEACVRANREALFVVVSNLLRNAIKYTDLGGIAVQYRGNTLYVNDTGCGIEEADLANIFMPFYRTRSAAESGRAGLGLGLTIVKRICDFYGWPIRVRSAPGTGTTFRVEFSTPGALFG